MIRFFIFLKFFIAFVLTCHALDISNLQFDHQSSGLSQSTVDCILQDRQGYLWFGTRNGLNRFDGQEFTIFEHNRSDSTSLTHNWIEDMVIDTRGDLWIGTNGGLNRWNWKTETFTRFIHKPDNSATLSNNIITSSLFVDSHDHLWVGTSGGGLNLYRESDETFIHFEHDPKDSSTLSHDIVTFVNQINPNELVVGTADYQINILNIENGKFHRADLKAIQETVQFGRFKTSVKVNNDLYISASPNIIIHMNAFGQCRLLDSPLSRAIQQTENIDILSLHYDNSNLWAGTSKGLFIHDMKNNQVYHYRHHPDDPASLNSDSIWEIYKDPQNRMWFGTYEAGYNTIDPYLEKFQHYQANYAVDNTLSHNLVTGFLEDKFGNIWVATDGGGLCLFNKTDKTFTKVLPRTPLAQESIQCIYQAHGYLWLGTWGHGFVRFDPKHQTYTYVTVENSELSSNKIFSICEDNRGNLVVGNFREGLDIFSPDLEKLSNYARFKEIRAIYKDSHFNIWVATYGEGLILLNQLDDGSIHSTAYQHDMNDPHSISDNNILCIYEDTQNRLWVGTYHGGLCLMDRDKETFQIYQKDDGLPSNSISSIVEDHEGNLWLGTGNGLVRFDPQTQSFKNYTNTKGIQGAEFFPNSALLLADGSLLFGGRNGFNHFDPAALPSNPYPPVLRIRDIIAENRSLAQLEQTAFYQAVNSGKTLKLPHTTTVLTFEYTGINFTNADKNTFAFKIQEIHENWVQNKDRQSATLANLSPGEYTFQVNGANSDGVWSTSPAHITFKIQQHWWLSWWAWAIYSLVFLTLILSAQRYWGLKRQHEIDTIKTRFFENISHEIRTPLTLINPPLSELMNGRLSKSQHTLLQSISKNINQLSNLALQLLDHEKTESALQDDQYKVCDIAQHIQTALDLFHNTADQRKIRLYLESPAEALIVSIQADKLNKILTNLISNALKFTPNGGEIKVSIQKTKQELRLFVRDTGAGMSPNEIRHIFKRYYQQKRGNDSKGYGIGLHYVWEMVQSMNGKIKVESTVGKGTIFKITVPFQETDLQPELTAQHSTSRIADVPVSDLTKILIVEDNPELQHYLHTHLHNFHIVQASNGQEGLKIAMSTIPDLIVSDVRMPVMDGMTMTLTLKQDLRTSHIPIILLTAKSETMDYMQGYESGADAYMTKPFDMNVLITRIHNLIENRKKLQEKFQGHPNDFQLDHLSVFDSEFMQKILTFLKQHLSEPSIDAQVLGKHVGLSRSQFYRKMKGLTGLTVNEFIRTYRLEQAAQLLKNPDTNVTHVAYAVGFNELSYFSKMFKNHFNMSPSHYHYQFTKSQF